MANTDGNQDFGVLRINAIRNTGGQPARGAIVQAARGGIVIASVYTDVNGEAVMSLPAGNYRSSLSPERASLPYAVYDVRITLAGHIPVYYKGVQLFPGAETVVRCRLFRVTDKPQQRAEVFTVPPHGCTRALAHAADDISPKHGGSCPSLPLTVTVHCAEHGSDGKNETVPYLDYLRAMCAVRLCPNRQRAELEACAAALISSATASLTLRSPRDEGYDYDIADPDFSPLLPTFCSTDAAVFRMFSRYGTDSGNGRCNVRQRGHLPFYGIVSPDAVGKAVAFIQSRLNSVASEDKRLPFVSDEDGFYGETTANAVSVFRSLYGLDDGETVDEDCWYALQYVRDYFKAGRPDRGGDTLRLGSRGADVLHLQKRLRALSDAKTPTDGCFAAETAASVSRLQQSRGLPQTGCADDALRRIIADSELPLTEPEKSPDSGLPYRYGDRGDDVLFIQKSLNLVAAEVDCIPAVPEDGVYGDDTRDAVKAFQKYCGLMVSGICNSATYERLNDFSRALNAEQPDAVG